MLLCIKLVIEVSVDQIEDDLVFYLSEVTGKKIQVNPLNLTGLPYFLSRQYALYQLVIGGTLITAVFLKQADEFKPAQFIKQMRQVTAINVDELCVIAHSLPTYVRKRLIEKGIAFVVPKVQMYLPALGMDLRSRPSKQKLLSVEYFSPATQVVLIHYLLGRVEGSVTPLELSKQLSYSSMSMSRALDELKAVQVAEVERAGRERLVSFTKSRNVIWNEILPLLRNPVSHVVRVIENKLSLQNALPAGITALANITMLNESVYPEYAVSREVWKTVEKEGIEKIPVEEPGTCLVQVWRYDPKVLEVDGYVDPFSLFLSLQTESDERIEMALDEMMEQVL